MKCSECGGVAEVLRYRRGIKLTRTACRCTKCGHVWTVIETTASTEGD